MIKTILIDDEPYIRKGLTALIESINQELDIIGECGSVKEAVTVVKACKPDLIFLDINLPDGNAFDFLAQTEQLDYKVVFVTAYDEYALKAIKAGAVDYILKPIDPEELETAINKVVKASLVVQKEQVRVAQKQFYQERIVISLHDGYQVIEYNELKYCESDKGYTTFHLSNHRSIIASKPLKHFEKLLPDSKFVRTHQSCLVNLDFVDRYDKNGMVVLKDNRRIPVSVRKKDDFLDRLLNRK